MLCFLCRAHREAVEYEGAHSRNFQFQGIRVAKWHIPPSFDALVGPGDATKTMLLDAIRFVLCSTYRAKFTGADFPTAT
jgi:hypothetical protein